MIRAILKDGVIQPLDPLPSEWAEGQELAVGERDSLGNPDRVAEWEREVDQAASEIPIEEHDRFLTGLAEVERQSKESARQEWGLP